MTITANYGAIKSADQFGQFVDRLIAENKPIGFDIESGYTGPDLEKGALLPFHPNWILVGFSFTNSPTDWARYVPIAHDSGDNVDDIKATARHLWRMLNAGLGVAHNATFELKGLSRWFRELLSDDTFFGKAVRKCMGLFPVLGDSMLQIFLLAELPPAGPGGGPGLNLKDTTEYTYGHKMVHFPDLFPVEDSDLGPGTKKAKLRFIRFNTRNLVPAVIEYACEDSLWCLRRYLDEMPKILAPNQNPDKPGRKFMYDVEMALMKVEVEMEIEAILLDWNKIHDKSLETARFRDLMNEEILANLSERLGENININLGSVPQLSNILFDRLGLPVKERSKKTNAPSTGESALRAIAKADPVIKRILEYREVVKLYGSYLNKYDTELNYAGNGRAYPNHNQTGALTGRFSVDGVSYQQWPKPYHYELQDGTTFDMHFKDLLISPPGFRIMGYDFSQVELRFLAGQAQETSMLEAFAAGVDIHKATAAMMFKIPVEQVTKKIRANGKTLNFAVVYGSGPENIAEMLATPENPVTKEDAQELLDLYFATFPKLKGWMDQRVVEGHEQGFVETLFGRKFTVWEYQATNSYIRSKGDRMCVNAPIQGGAADYMKIGMVRVNKAIHAAEDEGRIPVGGIRLVMTIHDALEFYVMDEVDSQTVIDIVQPAISFPVKGLPIEIRADWHEGYRWGSVIEIKQSSEKKISTYGIEDVDQEFDNIESAYLYLAEKDHKALSEVWPHAPRDLIERDSVLGDFEAPKVTPVLIEKGSDEHLDAILSQRQEPQVEEIVLQLTANRPGEKFSPIEETSEEVLTSEASEDDCPMALTEEEPPWLHSPASVREAQAEKVLLEVSQMPNAKNWAVFKEFVTEHPGESMLELNTPEGSLTLDQKVSVTAADQPILSLLFQGASLKFFFNEDISIDSLTEGIAL